ncbi:MAG: phosphoribosylamine--glycine ligase [Balneolales bacterium]|nr:phosphoribosylamine--glycine ligase [Balneolales bacterium]
MPNEEAFNVLLIGSGGREHALAWGLSKSPLLGQLYVSPGNPGTAIYGINVPDLNISDHEQVADFVSSQNIGLTIIGPEQPLVDGLTDFLEDRGHFVFGPTSGAAQLEGSKSFAKDLMQKYEIPTAAFEIFDRNEWNKASDYVSQNETWPLVVKADGLAGGKGVFICKDKTEAADALEFLQNDPGLSTASYRIVIEEFMEGEEVSVFAICDGNSAKFLAQAQDHKRIFDEDKGPNTGGMGAYLPAPVVSDHDISHIMREIVEPTVNAMAEEGMPFKGILYCGLMITKNGPKVVEYNCRFGDPECQVIIPSLKTDLLEIMMAAIHQKLEYIDIELSQNQFFTCVILASEGYPRSVKTGKEIKGIKEAAALENVLVFQSGTSMSSDENNVVITSAGRVLSVVATDETLAGSINLAYEAVAKISFEGMQYRTDIGLKGLRRL